MPSGDTPQPFVADESFFDAGAYREAPYSDEQERDERCEAPAPLSGAEAKQTGQSDAGPPEAA